MEDKEKIFLIDAYALIYRGYYAFIKNPRINSKGTDTSAIFGFMNSLLDLIKREKPKNLSVCFDKGGSKFRNEIFKEYKANRHETPEAIKIAVPYIKKILESMNISIIEKEGYEADDIIGTIAREAERKKYQTYMVTPDKDFAQLVSDNIFIYKPARMGNGIEIWGIPEVKKKFEVDDPKQVVDYLAMMGDSSDNIPGLPGVGDKTAKKFIKEYGSIENLIDNVESIKGKLKDKIQTNKELGFLSKKLAKILTNVPVKIDFSEFVISKPDFNKLNKIFEELEFKRISESILKIFNLDNKVETGNEKNTNKGTQINLFNQNSELNLINEKKVDFFQNKLYQYLTGNLEKNLFLEKLKKHKVLSFKIFSREHSKFDSEILGIGFSYKENIGYYFKMGEKNKSDGDIRILKEIFEDEKIEKISYDIKKDLKKLNEIGVEVKGKIFDNLIAHYLIDPDISHEIDLLSKKYLNHSTENFLDNKNIYNEEIRSQTKFICNYTDINLSLKKVFELELKSVNNKLYNEIEIPLIKVLSNIEREGVSLDTDFLKNLSNTLNQKLKKIEHIIFKKSGEEFNIASPKQLGVILFEKLKIVKNPKKTKGGQYSTAEEILSDLANQNTIVSDVLNWRSIQKILNTYVESLPKEINSKTNRVHTIFNQATVSTGRLSSQSPNLQNIPIRTDIGKEVRKAFIPRNSDYSILAADYSQIELRIIASFSNDKTMINSFLNDEDIHASTASSVYGINLNEVTRVQRSNAKTINFGIMYGVSAFGLSQQTDLSRTESKELIEKYYNTYYELNNYIKNQIDKARELGFVETILGRRRYLRNILSQNAVVRSSDERNAINAPIQGSAADIIKIAMINIFDELEKKQLNSKMILQVHDELVFEVLNEEIEELSNIVKEKMQNAYQLKVPLKVDIGIGKNWLEAH